MYTELFRSEWLRRARIVLASHYFTSGPANELEDYLSTRSMALLTIFHPFPESQVRHDMITEFVEGRVRSRRSIARSRRLASLGYAGDLMTSMILPFLMMSRVDLFIGSNPVNALAGLLLRRLGFARVVIFYKIDYVPRRFGNVILN